MMPKFTWIAPTLMSTIVAILISTNVAGFKSAESRPTNSFKWVKSLFFWSNSETSDFSREKARITLTPVRFSLVESSRLSSAD